MLDLLFGSNLPTLGWFSVSRCLRGRFGFPITCDHARSRRFIRGEISLSISALLAISCGPLPVFLSQKPHPPNTFIENKSQSAIRKACQKTVEAVFLCFSTVQSGPISAFFSRFYCPVGRRLQNG